MGADCDMEPPMLAISSVTDHPQGPRTAVSFNPPRLININPQLNQRTDISPSNPAVCYFGGGEKAHPNRKSHLVRASLFPAQPPEGFPSSVPSLTANQRRPPLHAACAAAKGFFPFWETCRRDIDSAALILELTCHVNSLLGFGFCFRSRRRTLDMKDGNCCRCQNRQLMSSSMDYLSQIRAAVLIFKKLGGLLEPSSPQYQWSKTNRRLSRHDSPSPSPTWTT